VVEAAAAPFALGRVLIVGPLRDHRRLAVHHRAADGDVEVVAFPALRRARHDPDDRAQQHPHLNEGLARDD
jgi:hypothetical protein